MDQELGVIYHERTSRFKPVPQWIPKKKGYKGMLDCWFTGEVFPDMQSLRDRLISTNDFNLSIITVSSMPHPVLNSAIIMRGRTLIATQDTSGSIRRLLQLRQNYFD